MVSRIKIKSLGLMLLSIFVLSACGQKRDLFLPEEPVINTTTSDSLPSPEPTEQGKN